MSVQNDASFIFDNVLSIYEHQSTYCPNMPLRSIIYFTTLVKKNYNPSVEIEGVLLTMYDGRLNLTLQVADEVKKYFGEKVYKNVIPRNVRLCEAPSHGMPVTEYDRYSKGSLTYRELAKEFLAAQEA